MPDEEFEQKREELNAAIERARLRALAHFGKPTHEGQPMTSEACCVSDFDFDLPAELIAQQPPAERGTSRMLVMDRATGALRDALFADLPSLLQPGDLLVLNDSRVIPARLYARRTLLREHEKPTGRIEVMLTEPAGENSWRALSGPAERSPSASASSFPRPPAKSCSKPKSSNADSSASACCDSRRSDDFFAILDRIGHMPLPPYIRRDDAAADRERYQTVFSRERGSVAAPTAGLHFTPQILDALAARGVEIARITLHVGLGTFAPLRVERLDEVRLHRERYTLSAAAADAINRAVGEGRRIVAVGTTVVRTLEHCALAGRRRSHSSRTPAKRRSSSRPASSSASSARCSPTFICPNRAC